MFRFRDYFFETLGLSVSKASVLARNTAITHYLLKTGWRLEQTVKGGAKSHATGETPRHMFTQSLAGGVARLEEKKSALSSSV